MPEKELAAYQDNREVLARLQFLEDYEPRIAGTHDVINGVHCIVGQLYFVPVTR